MTRPHVIRADTIDLQDPDSPSAKDHTRQPARPGMLGDGTPAPHQAEALKHVEMEISEQHGRSPRASADLSGKELQLLHDEAESGGYQDPSENLLRNSAQSTAQDETDEEDEDGLDDDLGDKISSSPSIGDDEDIDFEFVYALHTFVATVEGQANATKGDTMVLLDDSNSYWWLVRVVKDSSIGYLPAEHIETPLERLARLNKHRNLDLSSTMLGDQEDDKRQNPLNPLRKAMRRRNVKKVEFSATNSFFEPDDAVFSSEEEDEGDSELNGQDQRAVEEQTKEDEREDDRNVSVAPLNTKDRQVNGKHSDDVRAENDARNGIDQTSSVELSRDSDDTFERNDDGTSGKSRKGTVRNTDSFFRDESVETRKINLTPSLLRDDSAPGPQQAGEAADTRIRGNSLESLEKDTPLEGKKDDKKKKEKRGMLGGMFKRKDKKKDKEKEIEDSEKTSAELTRKSPTPKESMESLSSNNPQSPHRQTSKLQKQRPSNASPKGSYGAPNAGSRPVSAGQAAANGSATELSQKPASAGSDMRLVLPKSQPLFDRMPSPLQSKEPSPQDAAPAGSIGAGEAPRDRGMSDPSQPVAAPRQLTTEAPADRFGPPQQGRVDLERPSASELEPAVQRSISHDSQEKLQRQVSHESQQERVQRTISHESQERPNYSMSSDAQQVRSRDLASSPPDHHLALAQAAQHEPHPAPSKERLSDSPVQVSAPAAPERTTLHQPPPLVADTSSPSTSSPSPVSPPSSPEIIDPPSSTAENGNAPFQTPLKQGSTNVDRTDDAITGSPASSAPTMGNASNRSLPPWSDASLRAFMEDDGEIRDMLTVIMDTTGAKPNAEHPVVKNMYKEEKAKLARLEKELDGLLLDFQNRQRRKRTP